jgi:aspartyl/asparaginyl beta-hydroxylase (cupin superfamily)
MAGQRQVVDPNVWGVGAKFLTHPKTDNEHDAEINHWRHCDLQDIERKPNNQVALKAKHDQNREQERDQRKRADLKDEFGPVPLLTLHADKDQIVNALPRKSAPFGRASP